MFQPGLLPQEITPDTVLAALQARVGAANGITVRDLVYWLTHRISPSDERLVRKIIEKLRTDAVPICSHPQLGYFWPATASEVDSFLSFLVGRARTSLRQAYAIRKQTMPDLYGQLGLIPPANDETNEDDNE